MLAKSWPNASQPPHAGAFAQMSVCGDQFTEQVRKSCLQALGCRFVQSAALRMYRWPNTSVLRDEDSVRSLTVVPLQAWGSCRGSSPDTRGYTCALWLLFHTLAAHVTGDTGGALWMAAVK